MEKQFSMKLVPGQKDWGPLTTAQQELCHEHLCGLCNTLVQAYLEIDEWVNESVFPHKIWAFHALKLWWRYWIYWIISSFKPRMWHNSKIHSFLWIILVLKQLVSKERLFSLLPCIPPAIPTTTLKPQRKNLKKKKKDSCHLLVNVYLKMYLRPVLGSFESVACLLF